MSFVLLSSLEVAGANCATQADGFSPDDAAAGALAADEPAFLQIVSADEAPLTLLQLLAEVLVLLFGLLDVLALIHVTATCSELYHDKPTPMMTPMEEVLRQRAAGIGRVCHGRLHHYFSSCIKRPAI